MTEFGYALSSEEHGPRVFVEYARRLRPGRLLRFWREELQPKL